MPSVNSVPGAFVAVGVLKQDHRSRRVSAHEASYASSSLATSPVPSRKKLVPGKGELLVSRCCVEFCLVQKDKGGLVLLKVYYCLEFGSMASKAVHVAVKHCEVASFKGQ